MGRFRREQSIPEDAVRAVARATDEFRSAVELQVTRVFEAAESRALEVERAAVRRVKDIERQAQRELEAVRDKRTGLLSELLAGVERLESGFHDSVSTFRAEVDRMTARPEEAQAPPQEVGQVERASSADQERDRGQTSAHGGLSPGARNAPAPPQVVETLRDQIETFLKDGKSRAEAEDLLMQLTVGEDHMSILDEVYSETEEEREQAKRGRRGLRRRR